MFKASAGVRLQQHGAEARLVAGVFDHLAVLDREMPVLAGLVSDRVHRGRRFWPLAGVAYSLLLIDFDKEMTAAGKPAGSERSRSPFQNLGIFACLPLGDLLADAGVLPVLIGRLWLRMGRVSRLRHGWRRPSGFSAAGSRRGPTESKSYARDGSDNFLDV